jgi:quercetin dioxygenase-like cupin family protein
MEQLPKIEVGTNIRIIRENTNEINMIERGLSSPTVASLHQLALALEVPITDFFKDQGTQVVVLVKKDQRLRYYSHGVEMESLGSGLPNQQLEPFRVKIYPQAGNESDPISHAGQEFVQCLDGGLEYWVGNQYYQLSTGDSLLFDASQPHIWRNPTQDPVTLLLILQVCRGLQIARQRHLGE